MRGLEAAIELREALEGGEPRATIAAAEAQPAFIGHDRPVVGIERPRTRDGPERLFVVTVRVQRGGTPLESHGLIHIGSSALRKDNYFASLADGLCACRQHSASRGCAASMEICCALDCSNSGRNE